MASENREVHLFVLIHGLWGRPSHLYAAREELIKLWKEQHGYAAPKIATEAKENGVNGAETVTTEVEGSRRRSGRLRKKGTETPNGVSNGSTGAYTNGAGEKARAGSSSESAGSKDEVDQPDDLAVIIAGGMSSTLTYDGIDVNASRVAWEIDDKIAELEANGKRVTRFSVLGYSMGGLIARYLLGLLYSRSPSFFQEHRPVSFTTVACPHLGVPAYNSYFSSTLVFLGSRLLARTGRQLYVRDEYSDDDPRPLLEIMADPDKVFHQALQQFQHIQIFANGTRDFTVPYPSALIEPSDPFAEWEDQGLVVEQNASGLMDSWRYPDTDEKADMATRKKGRWKNPMDRLPPVLKDRFQYNPALMLVFPIVVPFIFVLMILRLSMDSRKSSGRISLLKAPEGSSASSSRHGDSIEHLRNVIGRFERHLERDLMEEVDPPNSRRRSKRSMPSTNNHLTQSRTNGIELGKAVRPRGPDAIENKDLPSLRVVFIPSQENMLRWLNQLEMDRYVTWYPDTGNSHAVAICRDPANKPIHNKGRGLLRFWAQTVLDQDVE